MSESVGSEATVERPGRRYLPRGRVRLGAVLAVAVAVGFVVWLVVSQTGGSSFSRKPVTPIPPETLTAEGLKTAVKEIGHPVYWAGFKPGFEYEFSRDVHDRILIRYLPAGTRPNAPGRYLMIGTYRLRDAYGAVQHAAREHPNDRTVIVPGGALAVYSPARIWAWWFAAQGSHYQAGVFTPNSPHLARQLVLGGAVVPVG